VRRIKRGVPAPIVTRASPVGCRKLLGNLEERCMYNFQAGAIDNVQNKIKENNANICVK